MLLFCKSGAKKLSAPKSQRFLRSWNCSGGSSSFVLGDVVFIKFINPKVLQSRFGLIFGGLANFEKNCLQMSQRILPANHPANFGFVSPRFQAPPEYQRPKFTPQIVGIPLHFHILGCDPGGHGEESNRPTCPKVVSGECERRFGALVREVQKKSLALVRKRFALVQTGFAPVRETFSALSLSSPKPPLALSPNHFGAIWAI